MTKKSTPGPTPAQFWAKNPVLAQRAIQYLSQHSTDQGLTHQILKSPAEYQQLIGQQELKGIGVGTSRQRAQDLVHAQLGALTQGGMDDMSARRGLLAELLQAQAGRKDNISATENLGDPIETMYKQFGDPTAEAIIKLGGTEKDPFETLSKNAKPGEAQSKLFNAVFARSPQGQKALAEQNPKSAAAFARVQLENQILAGPGGYFQITGQGGIADQYDAYLADKDFRSTATTAEKKAAGPALKDPLAQFGMTRKSLGIPEGVEMSGATIKAAAHANLDKERASLRQIGKPGDPGFATGVPIPGTQVDKFIKSLEKAGSVGKRLAQAMTSGGLSGQDAFVAYQELLNTGKLDDVLAKAETNARIANRLPKLPKNTNTTAGSSAPSTGGGPIQASS